MVIKKFYSNKTPNGNKIRYSNKTPNGRKMSYGNTICYYKFS